MGVVVLASITRCKRDNYEMPIETMQEAETTLRPGIEVMPGLMAYYACADEETHSLTSYGIWDTLAHAQQLDQFESTLDSGKRFATAGSQFERRLMNYTNLWRFGPLAT